MPPPDHDTEAFLRATAHYWDVPDATPAAATHSRPIMSIKSTALDLVPLIFSGATTFAAVTAAFYGGIFQSGDATLLWLLLAGGLAGAVVSAIGGKAIGIDIGLETIPEKLAVNICLALIAGPFVLDIAMEWYPGRDPLGLALMSGGTVAIFGASLLILIRLWAATRLKKLKFRFPQPPITRVK